MRIPDFLRKGDTIGIVAPSFGAVIEPYAARLAAAIRKFEDRGYRVVCADSVYKSDGLGISTDPASAAADLMDFYLDDSIDALISAGGGELMNETIKKWGCENTNFVNTNGWQHKNHYTTARDMAIITKHCFENEKLREIALTKKYTMPATNKSGKLKMENALLKATNNLEGLTFGKTGSWSESQCTITLGFKESGLSAIIVLLGDTAKGRAEDPPKLIKVAHDLTPGFIVTDSDKNVCNTWVKHGVKSKVSLDVKGLRYAYPKSQKASGVKVKTEMDILEAPVRKGEKVGKLYIYANKEQVGEGYLYAGEDVETGWLPSYLYITNRTTAIVGTIMVLIMLLGVILQKIKKR